MRAPARVGIVGSGVISRAYVANAAAFATFQIVACSDLEPARCKALAVEHALEAMSVEEVLASPSIDVVLNLTPPLAHMAVTRAALEAGKHVYSEKPLAVTAADAAELVRLAQADGMRLGCAPDIFLGRAYQTARALLDEGAIGEPLAASAAMVGGGQERWHPDPDIFFGSGAGPLLDMGPYYLTAIVALLGPVRRVMGFASTLVNERRIENGPRTGELFAAETPTHTAAVLELDGGLPATLLATFEAPGNYSTMLLVHGTEGELALPDPNAFDGPVQIKRPRRGWEDVPYPRAGARDARGLGLHDLVEAIAEGRPHRASAELAAHVVDVATSILVSGESGSVVAIESEVRRPDAMSSTAAPPVRRAAER